LPVVADLVFCEDLTGRSFVAGKIHTPKASHQIIIKKLVADFKCDAVGLASCGKGFLTIFYQISEKLQVDIEIGEKSTVDSDHTLVQVTTDKTVAVFFV
jgi:hypothetical protein